MNYYHDVQTEEHALPSRSLGKDLDIFREIVESLTAVPEKDRRRILALLNSYFGEGVGVGGSVPPEADRLSKFLEQKRPKLPFERLAGIVYYLQYLEGRPHITALDVSKANTASAQPKFADLRGAIAEARRHRLIKEVSDNLALTKRGAEFVERLPQPIALQDANKTRKPSQLGLLVRKRRR